MKLAGTERMQWFPACVAFTLSTKKSPTNRIWPPLGDWPLRPNYVRYRNVWYLVGKIIHRAIFSQKLKFLPWSSDALLAIKVPAGEKDPPPGFQRSKKPGAHRVKCLFRRSWGSEIKSNYKFNGNKFALFHSYLVFTRRPPPPAGSWKQVTREIKRYFIAIEYIVIFPF